MSKVWQNAPHGSGELLTLLAIADFSDDNGIAWPSVLTLAIKTRLSTRQVNRCILELKLTGWLSIYQIGGGRFKSNCYKINDPPLPLVNPDKMSEFPQGPDNQETLTSATETLTSATGNSDMGVRGNKVMNHHRTVKESSSSENDDDNIPSKSENLFHLRLIETYEINVGPAADFIHSQVDEFIHKFRESHNGSDPPPDWGIDAVIEAVKSNAKHWRYIEACLKDWSKNGRTGASKGGSEAAESGGTGTPGKQDRERKKDSSSKDERQRLALERDGGYRGLIDRFARPSPEDT